MPSTNATARLEARISADLHALLKRAAELQGRTMTDFVVTAVRDAAQRALERAENCPTVDGWSGMLCTRDVVALPGNARLEAGARPAAQAPAR